MRILCVSMYYKPAYVYGGPARSISALCEGLVELDARVTVFATDANGSERLQVPLGRPVDVDGVEVWYFPLALGGLSFFYSPALARALADVIGDFDLVVAECLWGHAMGMVASACARCRVPYVVPARGQLFPWSLGKSRFKKRIYLKLFGRRYLEGAAAVHCTSPAEAKAIVQMGLRARSFVVPNPIDVSRFSDLPARGGLRRRLGVPDGSIGLLVLGRLVRIKRPDVAVEVLAAAQVLGREVYLFFVGPDEEGLIPEIEAQAQGLDCAHRLRFTGLLDGADLLQALADSDLLLMPSGVQENFGVAALEAMSAGLPILVSKGVPVGRWAEEAGAGRAVDCEAGVFRQTALELLSDPRQLRAMGQAGRDLVQRRFDGPSVARQMLAQYEAIVATGEPLPV